MMAKGKEPRKEKKIKKVMEEYSSGSLKSSSGQKVTDKSQALAIGYSEARRAGEKVKSKKGK